MISPDLIITQPKSAEFPRFIYDLKRYRSYFSQILVSMSGTETNELGDLIKQSYVDHLNAIICDPTTSSSDWRTNSINGCIPYLKSEYCLFIEQDFIILNDKFLDTVFSTPNLFLCGALEDHLYPRIHPSWFLVKSDLLKLVDLDFAPYSHNGLTYDHFHRISRALLDLVPLVSLSDLGLKPHLDYDHLQGLTSNYYLISIGQYPNFNPEQFKKYNQSILDLNLNISAPFKDIIIRSAALKI